MTPLEELLADVIAVCAAADKRCPASDDRLHDWFDVPTIGQTEQLFVCRFCPASKTEPLELEL